MCQAFVYYELRFNGVLGVGLPLYGVLSSAPREEIAAWHSSRPAWLGINGHVAYRLESSKLVR